MARCLLTEDYDRTKYEIETPLTSKIDYVQVRRDLGVPDYVDSKNFLLERGLVTIWAAQKPSRLKELGSSPELAKIKDDSIPVLFLGGGAVKLLSKTANDPRSPLHREIEDIDLVASRKRGKELYKLLLVMGEMCGSRYYHFVTQSDRRFNAMRSGERYRVRAIDKIFDSDSVRAGTLDILIDDIDLRHKVDVRDAFNDPKKHHYTIGLENVLLAKCQYIFDVPKIARDELVQHGLEYRILDYPYFRGDRLLIGMEEKDLKDICSLLLDYTVGNGADQLNLDILNSVLGKDKKFALTFRLNFQNLLRNERILKHFGLANDSVETILSRANEVLNAVPTVGKNWNHPWWNVDVQTPTIFGKTPN
jgi:hypothetical protein